MIALFCVFLALFASPFKSKSRLEAENAALLMDGSRTAWELPVCRMVPPAPPCAAKLLTTDSVSSAP
jgi:hypothetical protein